MSTYLFFLEPYTKMCKYKIIYYVLYQDKIFSMALAGYFKIGTKEKNVFQN